MNTLTREISNSDDVIDSRDVIERIATLEGEREAWIDASTTTNVWENEFSDDAAELAALLALAEEGKSSPDWKYGETLIRGSYFKEYAMQLADDIGAINAEATWPNNCIDWDRAARELKMDYFSVDFDGIEYWVRS